MLVDDQTQQEGGGSQQQLPQQQQHEPEKVRGMAGFRVSGRSSRYVGGKKKLPVNGSTWLIWWVLKLVLWNPGV